MKKYALLMLGCTLIAALVIAWGLREPAPGNGAPQARVALLLSEDTGTYYMKLKSGAQDAAADLHAELSIFVAHDALPEAVTHDGYSAIIRMSDSALDARLVRQTLGDIPIVCVGGVSGDYSVLIDAVEDGRCAALALPLDAYVVVLHMDGDLERLDGALAALEPRRCDELAFSPDDAFWERLAALRPDAVLALNEEITAAAVEAKRLGLLDHDLPLSGFIQGDGAAALLESGLLDAATLPIPYAIGYQAVSAALARQDRRVAGRTVTGQTLFDAENVAIVFPLLQ